MHISCIKNYIAYTKLYMVKVDIKRLWKVKSGHLIWDGWSINKTLPAVLIQTTCIIFFHVNAIQYTGKHGWLRLIGLDSPYLLEFEFATPPMATTETPDMHRRLVHLYKPRSHILTSGKQTMLILSWFTSSNIHVNTTTCWNTHPYMIWSFR